MDKHLHIVSFNVPYPPDYGGVIDVYYKIKALHDAGIKVHLHSFHYGRDEAVELEQITESVQYYGRKKFYKALYSSLPYIVGSRQSDELLANLAADEHPILFEGLHTCFYLSHPSIRTKLKAVRMHNVEWEYYKSLKEAERNYLLKFYYNIEAKRLRRFEEELQYADRIFAVSRNDYAYLKQSYEHISFISSFHNNEKVTATAGQGKYILYHGNLGVPENNQAALFILKKIATGLDIPVIIAGKEPTKALIKEVTKYPNVTLIANPSFEHIATLIAEAQVNLLITFQQTGIKLKLLNALHRGRFCVVNTKMVDNTGLEPLCMIEDNPDKVRRILTDLMRTAFTARDIHTRNQVLDHDFSNQANATKIITEIWG
jgi:hypothetical protein